MRTVQGGVVVAETGKGVGGLTVAVFARGSAGERLRVGSVPTDDDGRFRLEAVDSDKLTWTLDLEVSVDGVDARTLYADAKPREHAGAIETWTIRVPMAALAAAGMLGHRAGAAAELPALGSFLARTVMTSSYQAEVRDVVRPVVDARRERAIADAALFRSELLARGRGGAGSLPDLPVARQVTNALAKGLTGPALSRTRIGFARVTEEDLSRVRALTDEDGGVPAAIVEPLLAGPEPTAARTAIDLLVAPPTPRSLDDACAGRAAPDAPPPATHDLSAELGQAVWSELQAARTAEGRRPSPDDVWRRIDGLGVSTGPADGPALHDFDVISIPFEDVWADLVDEDVVDAALQLQSQLERMGGRGATGSDPSPTSAVRKEARLLAREAPLKTGVRSLPGLDAVTGVIDPLGDDGVRWVSALLEELERKLAEPYRFTVYAADDTGTAINFGLVTTYRQIWEPLSYQAGRLVETITLAPREERSYTRKVTTASKRRVQTNEKFRSVTRTEEQSTQRAVRDIVATAEHRTGYEASGSYGAASGSMHVDDARTSSDTRQNFREAVRKAASEYENDHSIDVAFETARDTADESSGKLTNPNDELAVTFLFYQLQRRYRVSEHLHRVTPVVLVAQPVPAPNHINLTWILQHDWILRRALLDRSFAPALDLVSGSLIGEESTVGQLRANLDQQRQVVNALKDSLVAAHANSDVLFQGVQRAIRRAAGSDDGIVVEAVEKVVSWLTGGSDDGANRARLEAAREGLDRAEASERAIAEQLQRELSTLTVMTDKWASASRALLDKTVEVQRLRLHLKQNTLYYMQAIWDHEPPDQRHFRLHRIPVPVVEGQLSYELVADAAAPPLPPYWIRPLVVRAQLEARISGETVALGQVADLDRPLGYKGNYAIFPLRETNLISRFLMVPYVDAESGVHDPDQLANFTRTELERYFCSVRQHLTADELAAIRPGLEESYRRVSRDPRPLDEVIAVPTDALFIEALPADQPLLEDYKLRNRAADAMKSEAEASRVRLDNLRRGALILAGQLGDPEIERVTVVRGATPAPTLPLDEQP